MKQTYKFEITRHKAIRYRSRCRCGHTAFELYHQLSPITVYDWWVKCPICDRESVHAATRTGALWNWKHDYNEGDPDT